MKISLLPVAALAPLFATTLVAQTFEDDFNNDTSGLYNITQTADALATFAFDYSTLGIPVAPNTTDGTTLGLKMEANVTAAAANAVTLHTIVPAVGNYVVKFDVWVNANGPFPGGGAGSTEFITMGVGGDGVTPNVASTGAGGWFAASGEGGSSRDYRAYKDASEQFPASGQFNAGNNASDPYYSPFGAVDVGPIQGAAFAQQNGITQTGSFGFSWHEVEMRVVSDGGTAGATSVSWWVDGLQLVTLDAGIGSAFVTDGAVTIGYMDVFSSLSDNPALSFGLIDNFRFGTLAEATAFGAGCAGVAGDPALAAANTPSLGQAFLLDATNLDPAVPIAIMVAGFSNTTSTLGPLPVDLQLLGFGVGCDLLVSPDVLGTFGATAGSGTFSLPIPAAVTNLGAQLFFQVGSLDTVATGGIAVSNGIAVTVGL